MTPSLFVVVVPSSLSVSPKKGNKQSKNLFVPGETLVKFMLQRHRPEIQD
jgi:hypothetical protein